MSRLFTCYIHVVQPYMLITWLFMKLDKVVISLTRMALEGNQYSEESLRMNHFE